MEQSKTFYNRLPMWGKLVFILLYPISIPYGIYRMWVNRRFTPLVRTVLSAAAALAFLISIAPSTDATVIPAAPVAPQARSSVSGAAEAAKDAAARQAEEAAAEKAAAEEAEAQAAAQEEARVAAEQAAAQEAARVAAEQEAARVAAEQAAAQEAARVAAEQAAAAAKAAPPSSGGTVYITNTGEKYHRNGCQYLSKSQIPISLSDAQARGYSPCSRCF